MNIWHCLHKSESTSIYVSCYVLYNDLFHFFIKPHYAIKYNLIVADNIHLSISCTAVVEVESQITREGDIIQRK